MIFKEKLSVLLELDEMDFAHYLISQDPIEGEIRGSCRDMLAQKSIACGKAEAEELLFRFPTLSINGIVETFNIEVKHISKVGISDDLYLGTFDPPNQIRLYDENINKVKALLKEAEAQVFNKQLIEDIVLAHELFHKIEDQKPKLYTNNVKVKLFSLGPFTRESRLVCPGEIAGMAFAKRLLDLDHSPAILDYVFLHALLPEGSDDLFAQMMGAGKQAIS